MSESMRQVRSELTEYGGEHYARVRLMWLCQKYGNIMPSDDCPQAMIAEVNTTIKARIR